jgi:hypothetical protein
MKYKRQPKILKMNFKVFIRNCQEARFRIIELDQKSNEPLPGNLAVKPHT